MDGANAATKVTRKRPRISAHFERVLMVVQFPATRLIRTSHKKFQFKGGLLGRICFCSGVDRRNRRNSVDRNGTRILDSE